MSAHYTNVVMRPCKALPPCSARFFFRRRRLPAANRQHILLSRLRCYSTGSSQPQDGAPQPPVVFKAPTAPATDQREEAGKEEGEEHQQPYSVDSVNKKIETAVGDLPLSPVMDPTFWEARQQHRTLKANPGKPQNSVARQLRANAFAKSLATPFRQCTLTTARLPSFFLQDFNLIKHPETGKPWWVPHSLLKEQWEQNDAFFDTEEGEEGPAVLEGAGREISEEMKRLAKAEKKKAKEARRQQTKTKGTSSSSSKPAPTPGTGPFSDIKTASKIGQPYGPAAYILARRELLAKLSVPKQNPSPQALFGASSSRYRALARQAVWRADTDAYVLELLRRQAAGHLRYLSGLCKSRGRHYLARCYGWDDAQHKHKGAILWFGGPAPPEPEKKKKDEEPEPPPPPPPAPEPFAVLDTTTLNGLGEQHPVSVPVHNLPALLGDKLAARVRRDAKGVLHDPALDAEHGAIFMLAGRRTTALQGMLWKLQGYLTDYRELPWATADLK